MTGRNGLARTLNILCLLASIAFVLLLPLGKEIWYDESISILCSKGISHDTHMQFGDSSVVSSAQIEQFNTTANVFKATIIDNANSFLYNYKLHWFTEIFGNSIASYVMLSRLCAAIALIAMYVLGRLFFGDSLFTGIAVLLLAIDLNFVNMSYEIRAYAMGTMFVALGGVFFFKYLWQQERIAYLFLTSFFSVCTLLTHFLAVYIVAVMIVALLVYKGKRLFTPKNILAIVVPLVPLAVFLYFALSGLSVMNRQSDAIHEGYANYGFTISEAVVRSMKYAAIDFKVILPQIRSSRVVITLSFLIVIALYAFGLWAAADKEEKRKLHLLFALGISATLLLLVLSIRSHHYTSLYFRYHSFALPFCTLFISHLLYVTYNSARVRSVVKVGLPVLFVASSLMLLVAGVWFFTKTLPEVPNRYAAISSGIIKDKLTRVEVHEWDEAFIIQSLLPKGYKIEYFRAR